MATTKPAARRAAAKPPPSPEQWLAKNAKAATEIKPGLAATRAVCRQMGLRLNMPVIVVAGTNGKGSVCAALEAMLAAAGFLVGCYTSPHILRFGERIRIGGEPAKDAAIVDSLQATQRAARAAGATLTYFELATLAAAQLFAARRCDVVILEAGLGGRLDAVNVFSPAVSVITNIALDHCEWLGNTRNAIAREKAGVCRRNRPLVVGDSNPPPALAAAIARRGALPRLINQDFFAAPAGRCWHYKGRRQLANLPPPALGGAHQRANAACAIAALEALPAGFLPGAGAIRAGLHAMQLPARGQALPGLPVVVLDVAHNPAAAATLERLLFDMGHFAQTRAVFSMLGRKDSPAFARALARRVDAWYVAATKEEPGAQAALLAAAKATGKPARGFASVAAAARAARKDSEKNDRIVVTGSFLTVAEFLSANNKRPRAGKNL